MFGFLEFTVTQSCDGMLCKEYLKKVCNVSSKMITKLVRTEMGITRNGELLRTVDSVCNGDVIRLKLPQDENEIIPTEGELDVMYEDNHILIVNKPDNMPVHPTKNHQTDTLANIVRFYSLNKNEHYTFRAINRLDRDTSGLVVIAKDRYTASCLKGLYKEYTAVCQGEMINDGTVSANIRLCPNSKMLREVHTSGAYAVTHYKVLQTNGEHTLILCTLETGRTHQIRCHMSYLGFPLAGDDLYGGSKEKIHRQALHCSRVEFKHPVTGENIDIKSKIPENIRQIIEL
ncbi:MAG: RluA family pseudouridine synthase [Ruminococcus sp.]|nr:RluA family pseudouridine synthase [Ruminococcus sp.]